MPDGVVGSWGPAVDAYARDVLRLELDRWQRRALNRALAYGADGRMVHRIYVCSTGRQQGKTGLVRSLIGWALTNRTGPAWSSIVGLAHDRRQAQIPYRAVLADLGPVRRRLGSAGGLALTRYLGIRSDMYGRHREYHTFSREARDALRGESADLVVFDEIRTQRDLETWAAVEPVTTTGLEPLIFAISTAGDDRSVLLREWWERGLRIIDGAEPMGTFGMTWYAAPDELAPDDPRAWAAANPAMAEGRIPLEVMREAYRNAGSAALFRNERLNLWADALDEWLPAGVWAARTAPQPAELGRIVLGVEAVPSWRRATVTVALAGEDRAWVGVAGELDATRLLVSSIAPSQLVELLASTAAAWRPAAVAYSAAAAAAPHIEAWAASADIASVKLGGRELRAASELFRSELVGGRLDHAEDPLLALQARQARPSRAIEGGDWYLSIRESMGEVDAIRAAAWAAWAAIAPVEPEVAPQIFV